MSMFGQSLVGVVVVGLDGVLPGRFKAAQFCPPSFERNRSSWSLLDPDSELPAKAYTTLSPGSPTASVTRPAPVNGGVPLQVAPWSIERQSEPLLEPSMAVARQPALVFARLQTARPPKEALGEES